MTEQQRLEKERVLNLLYSAAFRAFTMDTISRDEVQAVVDQADVDDVKRRSEARRTDELIARLGGQPVKYAA